MHRSIIIKILSGAELKKMEIDPVTNLPARNADDTPKEPLGTLKKMPSVNARNLDCTRYN